MLNAKYFKKIFNKTRELSTNEILKFFFISNLLIYLTYFILKQYLIIDEGVIFFNDPLDHFADLLKIIFSFEFIFSKAELASLNVPDLWINGNPYRAVPGQDTTLAMTLPPFSVVFLVVSANLAKIVGYDYRFILVIYLFLALFLLFKEFKNFVFENKMNFFVLISYPMIFLFDRGNITAFISAFCLFLFLKNYLYNDKLGNREIILFIIACSIRPNYLVFGILFLFKESFKSNFLQFVKISSLFTAFNFLILRISERMLPNYSLDNFLYMLNQYRESNIVFNPWNSSLQGATYNIYMYLLDNFPRLESTALKNFIDRVVISPKYIYLIFFLYLMVLFYFYYLYQINKVDKPSLIVVLCCTTALTTTPFADYHLIIFIFTFFLIIMYDNTNKYKLTLFLILLVLLPKIHYSFPNLNISNILNTLLLNLLIFVNFPKNIKN